MDIKEALKKLFTKSTQKRGFAKNNQDLEKKCVEAVVEALKNDKGLGIHNQWHYQTGVVWNDALDIKIKSDGNYVVVAGEVISGPSKYFPDFWEEVERVKEKCEEIKSAQFEKQRNNKLSSFLSEFKKSKGK